VLQGGRDLDVLIIGAGAIGSLLAYRLMVGGHQVTAVGRAAYVRAITQRGLLIEEQGHVITAPRFQAVENVESLGNATFDLVLITTSAFDTAVAAVQARHVVRSDATVVVLQNGVGGVDVARGLLRKEDFYSGVTTIPVEVLKPAVIRLLGSKGGIGLAPVASVQDIEPLVRLFVQAGFETRAYENWQAMQWSKLMLSMLTNAIPAILDLPPDQILADRRLYELERNALCEARSVVEQLKLRLVSLPGYRVPLLVCGLCALPARMAYPFFRYAILHRRGSSPSPLQADLRKGQKSEAAFLNGAVARIGAQIGVATPINRTLYEILDGIARGEIEWSEYRGQAEHLIDQIQSILGSG
jgi:2-dehydropantoate 2-reductase